MAVVPDEAVDRGLMKLEKLRYPEWYPIILTKRNQCSSEGMRISTIQFAGLNVYGGMKKSVKKLTRSFGAARESDKMV